MLSEKTVVCFDLDDTLYKEIDFYMSGVRFIFQKFLSMHLNYDSPFLRIDSDWFNYVLKNTNLTSDELRQEYRNHTPNLILSEEARNCLDMLKKQGCLLTVITDGRSITQRNKLTSLSLLNDFGMVVISEEIGTEKPSQNNFRIVMDNYPDHKYIYIGDNTNKDFISPNKLGWETICLLDDGRNIHSQDFSLEKEFLPKKCINSLLEIEII